MNKYQRQSQKTNLWARRRNKTAELLLDARLRYLEKSYKQGIKQHLNGTFRLEEDLRELAHVTNIPGEDLDHHNTEITNGLISKRETFAISHSCCNNFDVGKSNASNPCQRLNNDCSKPTSISLTDIDFHKNSTKVCKFRRDGKSLKNLCRHFPCSIPSTYHALGFRRDDVSTWGLSNCRSDILNTSTTHQDYKYASSSKKVDNKTYFNENENSSEFFVLHKEDKKTRCDVCSTQEKQKDADESCLPSYPRWMSGNQPKKFSFRPVSGPSFGLKPQDPILERVRQGMSYKPTHLLDRTPARMTVAGRMRGLNSLISEMREKHEKARPVDWAVNYGQRLPMRVLLNPVVPVGVV